MAYTYGNWIRLDYRDVEDGVMVIPQGVNVRVGEYAFLDES